jgi:hypothetical protein
VLSLILILLVVFVVLSLLLAAWTLFFQGYIYSEPVGAIYWRAPAAGAALTLFLIVWIAFDYNSVHDRADEGRYQPLHNFSSKETETYKYLWIYRDGRKEQFTRQGDKNLYVSKGGKRLPERPFEIIASHKAEGDEHVFKPRLDDKGHFKTEDGEVRYYEEGNDERYMVESYPGQVSISHFGWLLMALILNLGFLFVWFLCLWLLLEFQWPHALGLAFVAWLISLFILPMILTQAEKVRKERLPPKTTAIGPLRHSSPPVILRVGSEPVILRVGSEPVPYRLWRYASSVPDAVIVWGYFSLAQPFRAGNRTWAWWRMGASAPRRRL